MAPLNKSLGRTGMRVEYENTFRDIVVFNTAHQFVSPVVQFLYGGFAVFVFAAERHDGLGQALLMAATVYGAMWLAQVLVNVAWLYSRKNKRVLTRHILEIRDDVLYE